MSRRKSVRLSISLICFLLGFSFFTLFALSLRLHFAFPIELYYLSFVLVSLPLILNVFFWHDSKRISLISLLAFSVLISLQYAVVDTSPVLWSSDATFDYKLTSQIISDSKWKVGVGEGDVFDYSSYPISNMLYAAFSMLTGIPLVFVVKYLLVIRAIIVVPVYKLFSRFFSERVSYLAALIFLASPGAVLWPHKQELAMIFFVLGIYAMINTSRHDDGRYSFLGFLSAIVLIMTHHFSSYIFLALITVVFVAGYFLKFKTVSSISITGIWVFFASWTVFVSWEITKSLELRYLIDSLSRVFTPSELTNQISQTMFSYPPYQTIIADVGLVIIGLSATLGLLYYLTSEKKASPQFKAATLFMFVLLVFASALRFTSSPIRGDMPLRTFEFGFLFVAPLSAFFFIKVSSRNLGRILGAVVKFSATSAVAIVLLSAIVLGALNPWTINIHPVSTVSSPENYSRASLSFEDWLRNSSSNDSVTIGDRLVYNILYGYGGREVVWTYPYLYYANDLEPQDFGSLRSYLYENQSLYGGNPYIAVYSYMMKTAPNFGGSYTDVMIGRPLNGTQVEKFDDCPCLQRIYSSNTFTLYLPSSEKP